MPFNDIHMGPVQYSKEDKDNNSPYVVSSNPGCVDLQSINPNLHPKAKEVELDVSVPCAHPGVHVDVGVQLYSKARETHGEFRSAAASVEEDSQARTTN